VVTTRPSTIAPARRSAVLRADVLGELTLSVDAAAPFPPRGMHAEILAILTLAAGRHVSAARLIDQLWTPSPPANAAARLHVHISRVRRVLADLGAPDVLATRNDGYVLDLDLDGCDFRRFESLTARGTAVARAGDAVTAATVLTEALRLWRGPVLGELRDRTWAQAEVARLSELRWQALEGLASAHLAAGRPTETVAVLERAAEEDPLRERTAAVLMVALYRSGRQADALAVYARTRAKLSLELGVDPAPPLAATYLAILRQDAAVAADAPAAPSPGAAPPGGSARGTAPAGVASPGAGGPGGADPADGAGADGADGAGAAAARSGTHGADPGGPAGELPVLVDLPHPGGPFRGRDVLLDQVGRALDTGSTAATGRPAVVVLVGMGGAGKTRLALEVAQRAVAERTIVHWVPAAEPVGLVEALGRLAVALGISAGADQAAMVSRVRHSLGSRRDWLIVFDDCPDPATLAPFLPTAGRGTSW